MLYAMKKTLLILASLLLWVCSSSAAVLLVEDFNYVAGSALEGQGTPNAWTVSTKADNAYGATPSFSVSSQGMTMLYYGAGAEAQGLGAVIPQATLENTSKQRVLYKTFDTNKSVNSGAVYAAFLLNVATPSNNARDFMSFDGSTATTQRGRLFTKKAGTGYQIGITRANTTPVYTKTLELGKTYLVVLKYAFVEGTSNDVASVYVDFPLGYKEANVAEYASVSTDVDAGTSDPSGLKAIDMKIRDGGSSLQIAHLRIATTWEEAVNYTGPEVQPVEPEDENQPKTHFEEGFDTNGAWTIIGAGASTSKNHGDYGTAERSISFNKTESADKCNNARMISPSVKTAGVLRFWLTGSANETRGNILVSKITGKDTTEVAYLEGPFGKTWTEHLIIINDASEAVKVMLTVSDCGLGAGTLYIDDVSLTNYVAGSKPFISGIALTQPFPSAGDPTRVSAVVSPGEEKRTIANVQLLYGSDENTEDGQLSMSLAGDVYRSEALPAGEAGSKVYYRVVAFDNYYVSDTSAVYAVTMYARYSHNLPPRVLAAGESVVLSEGLEGLRVDFGEAGGTSSLSVTDAQKQVYPFSGSGMQTTGDMPFIAEPGAKVTITNTGSTALPVSAIHYNTFRPVVFTRQPQRLQLYPRKSNNKAVVEIAGVTQQSDISQITFKMYRNKAEQASRPVSVSKGVPFAASFEIEAEPADYKFTYSTNVSGEQVLADSVVAGDVYVIAGQSNGAAAASGNPGVTNLYWRNFGCVQKTVAYNPSDTTWGMSNSAGWGYGRQYYNGWSGYVVQRNLLQEQNMPTAVINIAIGGSSLNQNMPNEADREDLNTFYGEGLYRLRKAGLADDIKAIIWVQGESDQNGLYEDYAMRFDKLYKAWKQDYPNVQRIYVSQINVGCGTSPYASEIREMQRLFGETYPDVTVITNIGITIRYDSCHYEDAGYDRLYTQFTRLIERDFYGRHFDQPLTSPAVQSVQWTDENKSTIAIRFDQEMVWPGIMWGRDMKDYFYDEKEQAIPMKSGRVDAADKRVVLLELESTATRPTHLTYGPDNYVYSSTRGMDTLYVDPWLRNNDGYAAMTFNRYPIADYNTTAYEKIEKMGFLRMEGEELIAESTAGIDSIIVYSVLGQMVKSVAGERCSLADLPRGIYSVRINLRNGEGLSTKIRK